MSTARTQPESRPGLLGLSEPPRPDRGRGRSWCPGRKSPRGTRRVHGVPPRQEVRRGRPGSRGRALLSTRKLQPRGRCGACSGRRTSGRQGPGGRAPRLSVRPSLAPWPRGLSGGLTQAGAPSVKLGLTICWGRSGGSLSLARPPQPGSSRVSGPGGFELPVVAPRPTPSPETDMPPWILGVLCGLPHLTSQGLQGRNWRWPALLCALAWYPLPGATGSPSRPCVWLLHPEQRARGWGWGWPRRGPSGARRPSV